MTTKITNSNSTLYSQDYYLWLEQTIEQLRHQKFEEIDLGNLLEELNGMSRSEKRAIYSNLKILLIHLLKYRYQPEHRSKSWLSTIEEHRQRLEDAFEDSPSLKPYFLEVFEEGYQKAKRLAATETGLSLKAFPSECPFSPEDTLDPEYLPS